MPNKSIKKAVIAAAGYGTRFLPATKNIQKEMLPVINAPIIHYAVKEVIEAGVTDILIVARKGRIQIKEYFSEDPALKRHLEAQGKMHYLEPFEELYAKANISVIYQDENMPYGNGTPLLCGKEFLKSEDNFLYLFSDDLVHAKTSCCSQLVNFFHAHPCDGVLAVQKIPMDLTYLYGVVKLYENRQLPQVEVIVEKPDPAAAPSNLVSFGRYILPSEVFTYLTPDKLGKDNELWLADAVAKVAETGNLLACEIEGYWLTTGDPLNLLQANIEFTLGDEKLKPRALAVLRDILKRYS